MSPFCLIDVAGIRDHSTVPHDVPDSRHHARLTAWLAADCVAATGVPCGSRLNRADAGFRVRPPHPGALIRLRALPALRRVARCIV